MKSEFIRFIRYIFTPKTLISTNTTSTNNSGRVPRINHRRSRSKRRWWFLTLDKSCNKVVFDSWHEENVNQRVSGAADVEQGDGKHLGYLVIHRDGEDGGYDGGKPADYPRHYNHC